MSFVNDPFESTRWDVFRQAASPEPEVAKAALGELFETYLAPIRLYIRAQVDDSFKAQDLTQGFLAHLLQTDFFQTQANHQGRFRAYLIGTLKRYLISMRRKETAKKRGYGTTLIPIHTAQQDLVGHSDQRSPEKEYHRAWARALVSKALEDLRLKLAGEGMESRFESLKPFLLHEPEATYQEAAKRLGMTPSAVKSAIRRLRQRFQDGLRDQLAATVSSQGDVEEEIRFLLGLFED